MHDHSGGVGSVGILSRLVREVFNVWAGVESGWGGDHIGKFFLLVQQYNRCSQIQSKAIGEKVEPWDTEVERLTQQMKQVPSRRTKEEANYLAEQTCALMRAIIKDKLRLDPDDNIYISEDWKEVKGKTKALREDKRALPSALSLKGILSPPTQPARPTTFRVTIHVCPIEDAQNHSFHVLMTRNLTFPAEFAEYSLSPLIFYTLVHPRKKHMGNTQPSRIQAMDTVYLRYLESMSPGPAIWGPVDPCSPLTLKRYHEVDKEFSSRLQVRLVQCNYRFLMVSTYQSGQPCEGIYDLDSATHRDTFIEALAQGQIPLSTASGGVPPPHSLPNGTPIKGIVPRTCFVLRGPNQYETFYPMQREVNDLSFIK